MNKNQKISQSPKFILPLFAVAALIIGGFIFWQTQTKPPPTSQAGLSPQESDQATTISKIKDALSLGKSMVCTWEINDQNKGLAKIKDNQVYSEFEAEGIKSYMISKDNCAYSWSEQSNQGVKFCADPDDQAVTGDSPEDEAPSDFAWETPGINYSCQTQIISDAVFALPENINFADPMEQLKNLDLPEGFEIPQM